MSYHIFICTKFTGEIASTEETEPEWVKIDKLDNYNLLPNVHQIINDGLKYLKQ